MRSMGVHHRRGGRGGEEKKDDHDNSAPPLVPLGSNDDDRKGRRHRSTINPSSLVRQMIKLGNQLSSSLSASRAIPVEYRKQAPIAALLLLLVLLWLATSLLATTTRSWYPPIHVLVGLKVTFPVSVASREITLPGPFYGSEEDFHQVDYGEIEFELLDFDESSKDVPMRPIKYTGNEEFWYDFVPGADGALEGYYHSYDDDVNRNPYRGWGNHNKNHLERTHHCRMNGRQHREQTPTCNEVHAIDFNWYATHDRGRYLGGGSFRDVFLLEKDTKDPLAVLKTASYGVKYKPHNYEYYRMDSAVMTALYPHPLVVDIYSSCQLALVAEAMSRGDVNVPSIPEYNRHHCDRTDLKEDEDELVKMNDIPADTKLKWALQMAESIALLHNHWRGVIVHDDVQPFQWLIADDGNIKMNDFNRAEFMLYDEEHGEYCKYKNGVGPGDDGSRFVTHPVSIAEEYKNEPLDEKIDIFSIGNNFYSLLTGVYPIYTNCHDDQIGKYIRKGEKPYIDPLWAKESFAEAELARIINECWHYHPENRPTATELVLMLREAVDKNRKIRAKGFKFLEELEAAENQVKSVN